MDTKTLNTLLDLRCSKTDEQKKVLADLNNNKKLLLKQIETIKYKEEQYIKQKDFILATNPNIQLIQKINNYIQLLETQEEKIKKELLELTNLINKEFIELNSLILEEKKIEILIQKNFDIINKKENKKEQKLMDEFSTQFFIRQHNKNAEENNE